MIQSQDHPWWQPCVTPVVHQPPADQEVLPEEGTLRTEPSTANEKEALPPPLDPSDQDEWMMLL